MSARHISECICGGIGHFAILKFDNGKTVPVVYCSKCDRYTCLKNETKDAAIDEWNDFNRVMSGGVLG